MKIEIKTSELQIGDLVAGYNKIVKSIWKSGTDATIVATFEDGSEWLTYKQWHTTVLREESAAASGPVGESIADDGMTAVCLGDDRLFDDDEWDEYETEPDYGGAFDGFTVSSDADSGL